MALTLRSLGGLSTAEVARAFLISEPALAQRVVRAKRKIREAGIAYRVPSPDELPERLAAVLAVIYLIFNAGYLPSSGAELVDVDLCDEALRLCGVVDRPAARRARTPGPGRHDVVPGRPAGGAGRRRRHPGDPRGAGPVAVGRGRTGHRIGPAGAVPAGRAGRPLRTEGLHRRAARGRAEAPT